MTGNAHQVTGGMINGFQAMIFLWTWLGVVLIHGLFWRSLQRPEPDPIRPAGPIY